MKFSSCGVTIGTALVVLFGLTNPASAAIDDQARPLLDDAKRLWASKSVDNYEYTFQRQCECLPDYQRPVKVRVNPDGDKWGEFADVSTISPAVLVPDGYEVFSIDDLFMKIETAINENYHSLTVTYDTEFGYPTSLNIDENESIVDEEFIASASLLKIVDGAPNFGPDEGVIDAQTYLSNAVTLWESNDFVNYDFQYVHDCFCEAIYHAPKMVSVRNNQITKVQFLENSELELPDEVPQEVIDQILDVNGLFDKIQDSIDNEASEVTCTYDEKYGHPTSILLDKEDLVADDEFRAKITSMEIIQDTTPTDPEQKDYTKTQATLDSQKLVWASQNLATYDFDYKRECRCLPEIQRPKFISVVDNAIASALYSDDQSEVSANMISGCPTIDGLFEIIQDAITDENDEIVVTYNTPFGYPETIYLNPDKDIDDDEITLKIDSFTFPVPGGEGRLPGNTTDNGDGGNPSTEPPTESPTSASTMRDAAVSSYLVLGLGMIIAVFGSVAM